ncbi:MAG: helix-turn-helix transcriptional regulator [bacterium]|nr:helix-turn-helix transcriptional regulator [bacterium]
MSTNTIKSLGTMGNRLRELRKDLRMTQEELGKLVGLRKSGWGQLENGRNFPKPRILHFLAKQYNISMDYILCGRGSLYYNDETEDQELTGGDEDEFDFLMREVPLVSYSIMSYFERFKIENSELIQKELERMGKNS